MISDSDAGLEDPHSEQNLPELLCPQEQTQSPSRAFVVSVGSVGVSGVLFKVQPVTAIVQSNNTANRLMISFHVFFITVSSM